MVRTTWRIFVGSPEGRREKTNHSTDGEQYLNGFQTGQL